MTFRISLVSVTLATNSTLYTSDPKTGPTDENKFARILPEQSG